MDITSQDEGFLGGIKACLPTVLGYLSIGLAAGVVEKTSGLSIVEVLLTSILIYAGSAQFIAAGMLSGGSTVSAIVLTVLFVNARHLLLSASISLKLRRFTTIQNMLIGSLLTDETFGVASSYLRNRELQSVAWMHGLNVTAYLNWILATGIGAWLGRVIPNPQSLGLNFALPAMFIGLLVLQLEAQDNQFVGWIVALSAGILAMSLPLLVRGTWTTILVIILAALIGMGVETWKSGGTSYSSSSEEPL